MAILLATLAVCGSVAAQGGGGNSYAITGIDVDVNATDAVKAREQGIQEAKRRASRMLVDRLVAAEDRGRVPPLDDARLDGMVRGVEFVRERSAPNRYIATLNVVFAADMAKSWLADSGVKVVETVARPALLIPLWKSKAGVEPLDDRNAWREAWRTLDTAGSAVPVTVIRADPVDQNLLTSEQAYVGDVAALSRLNERYRAPTIIVAIVEGDKDSGALSVGGIRYDTQTGARSEIAKVPVESAGQLAEAAKKVHARVNDEWRSIAVVRRDSQDAIDVVVPIRALGDWVQVRQRLGGVPAVKSVVVRSLESDRAELHLEYYGTADELQRTLAQAGLRLDKEADQWRLQPR
ncbi:DUF2066 domain-containing protein [Reyranella sp.]|uniref:DUF2066 domain-containing protein n=1 Tax=Reyranella sp. TaxID=1929291 RepID=UPI0025CC1D1B|nr:DUF2066 domain-containing protein [Reyranella sp.]